MKTRKFRKAPSILTCTFLLIVYALLSCSGTHEPGNVKSPDAVTEVLNGKRIEANAAWWGFDENDATDALQSAINSGAKKVIVPNVGKDWIVRPVFLKSNQEIIFEDGVVVTAKKGEFKGKGDCLFRGDRIEKVTLRGYGATLRMRKQDYMSEDYEKAEWRMVLGFYSSSNIKIFGLTLKDSGGDGIYLGVSGDQNYCKNIHIKDVVCDNNYRQGISVISVENLLIENCMLKNTWGTPPSAGIDLEPNHALEKMKNCTIRNCSMVDNEGPGILVYLRPLSAGSEDLSIRFENCRVTSEKGSGIVVGAVKDDGPSGAIEFSDCSVENTAKAGLRVYDKSADRARIRFINCIWKNTALDESSAETPSPLWIYLRRPSLTEKHGGVDFIDCTLEDNLNRPFLTASEKESSFGVFDITGNITVRNPHGARMDLGVKSKGVTLEIGDR